MTRVRLVRPRLLPLRRSLVLPGLIVALAALVAGAGAAAAFEADTVGSYWEGLWWALSLMTTVGFLDGPPHSVGGAVVSAVLMVSGFLLLSLISAALASLFVREDEEPLERQEQDTEREILERLAALQAQVETLERRLAADPTRPPRPPDPADGP